MASAAVVPEISGGVLVPSPSTQVRDRVLRTLDRRGTAICGCWRLIAAWKKSSATPSVCKRLGLPKAQLLQPPLARRILDALRRVVGEQADVVNAVILCPTPARFYLKRLLEPFVPKMVVLSPGEIPPAVPVQTMATLS